MVKPSHVVGLVLLLGMALSSGYAAVGLTLLGVGGGIAAGTGVSCTLDSIADKTFTAPKEELRAATLKTLKRIDMEVKENQPTEWWPETRRGSWRRDHRDRTRPSDLCE